MVIKSAIDKLTASIAIPAKKRKPSLIKEVIDKPENFKLEAYIEGEEVVMRIKRKDLPYTGDVKV